MQVANRLKDAVGLLDDADVRINPATEDKQDDIETTLTNIETAIQIMDDWDSANTCKVSDGGGSLTIDNAKLTALSFNIASDLKITLDGEEVAINDGGNTITVDGTLAATQSGAWNVTTLDGSVVTAYQGGTWNVSVQEPLSVDDNGGSLTIDGTVAATQSGAWNVTTLDGSVVTAYQGGVWTVTVQEPLSVDDNGSSLTVDGTVAATQSGAWNVTTLDGSVVTAFQGGTWDIGTLTSITNDVSIDDGGNSITVDDGGGALTIDGSVTIQEPLSVDDNGGSLTVDGTVAATQSGAWNVTTLDGSVVTAYQGGAWSVTVQEPLSVDDNGSSLTVDAVNLDIRDLTDASDSVKIGDGVETANVNASNELQVRDDDANTDLDTIAGAVAGNEMQVDIVADGAGLATESTLNDIKTAVQIMDDWDSGNTCKVSDGGGSLTVDGSVTIQEPLSVDDNGSSLTVDAVNLDIRDLTSASDSVEVKQSTYANLKAQTQITDGGLGQVSVTNNALYIGGDESHDAADNGNPLKIGGKAIDYEPDTDAEQGASEVAANDRANAAINLRGQLIEGVNSRYNVLDNVSTTYDDGTSTTTSTAIECWNYRKASIAFDLAESGTATDILFEIDISHDGTNYHKLMTPGFLQDWRITDGAIAGGKDNDEATFDICCQKIRLRVTATGTTAANTFTVSNASIYLRN